MCVIYFEMVLPSAILSLFCSSTPGLTVSPLLLTAFENVSKLGFRVNLRPELLFVSEPTADLMLPWRTDIVDLRFGRKLLVDLL